MELCHTAGMKNKTSTSTRTPTPHQYSLLRQVLNFIPQHLVAKLARQTGVEDKARTFSPWSHVVSLIFAQLTHAVGLNDVCDSLRLYGGPLSAIRAATAPSRNTLSYANKHRDAALGEQLFWKVLDYLKSLHGGF